MTPGQTKHFLGDQYDKTAVDRELQAIWQAYNALGITPNVSALKTTYAAADLATAAQVAAALNAQNTAINAILAKLNLSN